MNFNNKLKMNQEELTEIAAKIKKELL
jgi:hypothetical protein